MTGKSACSIIIVTTPIYMDMHVSNLKIGLNVDEELRSVFYP